MAEYDSIAYGALRIAEPEWQGCAEQDATTAIASELAEDCVCLTSNCHCSSQSPLFVVGPSRLMNSKRIKPLPRSTASRPIYDCQMSVVPVSICSNHGPLGKSNVRSEQRSLGRIPGWFCMVEDGEAKAKSDWRDCSEKS